MFRQIREVGEIVTYVALEVTVVAAAAIWGIFRRESLESARADVPEPAVQLQRWPERPLPTRFARDTAPESESPADTSSREEVFV